MSGTGQKWLAGCGLGCGLALLLVSLVGTTGFWGFKKFRSQADGVEATQRAITAEFGAPSAFRAAPDGVIAAERIEVFLEVRTAVSPRRQKVAEILRTFDGEGSFVAKTRAGVGLVPAIMDFFAARNGVFLRLGMGLGEYQYIYSLAYYTMLGKEPADGPEYVVVGTDVDDTGEISNRISFAWSSDPEARPRGERARRAANAFQVVVLAKQLDDYRQGHRETTNAWVTALAAEVALLRASPTRLAWQDGLPPPLAQSFAPYADLLDEAYDPLTNVIEMGVDDLD